MKNIRQGFWIKLVLIFALIATVACYQNVFAAGEEGADEENEKLIAMDKNIAQKREKVPVIALKEKVESIRPKPVLPEAAVMVKQIVVTGSTLLADSAVNQLNSRYANREMIGKEMQRCADLVTRAYSREGYITSYAYPVADKLSEGVLELRVVENKIGSITIQGNKNFSTKILRKKITLQQGDLFNFSQLQIDIFRMNKHPDRKATVALDFDAASGDTNITITVKDKLPVHVTLQVDNYGSEYILYKRYKTIYSFTNLSGHDDSLAAKVQWAEGDAQKLYDLDYNIPLSNVWKLQVYYMPYKIEDYYYKNNKDVDFEKKARKGYFNFFQSVINEPDCELVMQYGFVYKDIFWYQRDERAAWDKFRAVMLGFDLNRADRWGRTVIYEDLEMGIPGMWGGSVTKDNDTSVTGASGAYVRNHLVVARRQKLFAGIDFLLKTHWQLSSRTLTGVNEFSVGGTCGVIDMRGYPRAQAPGDSGRAFSAGFSFPPYLVPRNLQVPFSKAKLYDALKLFTFYDWAESVLKNPSILGDQKTTTLASYGVGFTFTLPENFSLRLDCGWPATYQMGKDGDHFHSWWSVTKGF